MVWVYPRRAPKCARSAACAFVRTFFRSCDARRHAKFFSVRPARVSSTWAMLGHRRPLTQATQVPALANFRVCQSRKDNCRCTFLVTFLHLAQRVSLLNPKRLPLVAPPTPPKSTVPRVGIRGRHLTAS